MKHASADGKGTASLGTKECLIRARFVAIMALLVAVMAGEVDAAAEDLKQRYDVVLKTAPADRPDPCEALRKRIPPAARP